MMKGNSAIHKVMIVFGTRPEAIKLFPVITSLRKHPTVLARLCVTGQHRALLDQVMLLSGLVPDIDLDLMTPNQSLDGLTASLLTGLGSAFDSERPDRVVVQGDTATAMAGALAAYYRKIPVSHVEAGLRSGDIHHPWPEEVNRKIIATIADQSFAPTERAAAALAREGVSSSLVHVTGNTVIDALLHVAARLEAEPSIAASLDGVLAQAGQRRIIAVTMHRRENHGEGMANIVKALGRIAERRDVMIVFPAHPNPHVRAAVEPLATLPNIVVIDPLDYPQFVRLLMACHLVVTDSGGVQEEAPALGKPVLVTRETTERPEGVAAGTARLVGTEPARIVAEIERLLDDQTAYNAMARAHNPFGDGQSGPRIARLIADAFATAA